MSELNGSPQSIASVSPKRLEQWLEQGDTVLVDVREGSDHAAERIEGAHHFVLSKPDPQTLRGRTNTRRVVLHCRTGGRTTGADERSRRAASAPRIDVLRQAQLTAGTLVLAGVLLGAIVSPWFLLLSGFVGAGLLFAGGSGQCGMAVLLARMPWNRPRATQCLKGETVSSTMTGSLLSEHPR